MDHEIKTQAPIIIQPDDMTIKIKDFTVPIPVNEEKEDNKNGQMV